MSSHRTGLSKAFGDTSDPHYLFQSQTHANALNLLAGGTEEGRNIRVLIGEPGMGKTILLLHLLGRFRHSAFTAHLFWTQLGGGEFLHYFLHELGVLQPPVDIAQAQKQLTRVLEREFSQGRGVVVAIDEAHDLEVPALLGLAELLDCNLARSKRLQVVLAGLPHLVVKLALSPELQGIRDRISAIASLSPLTPEETVSYINRRLEVSGYRGDVPFTSGAIATIAELAEGIPRNINNICFGALYLAEKRSCSVIDRGIILETARREGRLTGQDITQEASSENLTIPHHAADQVLDLLRAIALQEVTETRVCSSRWAALALLIALVALAVGLAGGHRTVLKRKDSVMRLAQQLTGRKPPSKALIAGKESRTVPSNSKTNPFSPLARESAQESAPPVSSTSQPLSATPVPQQHGGRPEAAETTVPFQQGALSGDPNAQFELGTAYATGRGVPADPVIAYTWLTLAFVNGDEQAESSIRELTRKLSQSEIARIRWNLGEMYANGVGVHPDKVTAYMWHLLAESAGETRSRIARSQLDPTMTTDQKSEANARASQWLRRHHQSSKPVSLPAKQM